MFSQHTEVVSRVPGQRGSFIQWVYPYGIKKIALVTQDCQIVSYIQNITKGTGWQIVGDVGDKIA